MRTAFEHRCLSSVGLAALLPCVFTAQLSRSIFNETGRCEPTSLVSVVGNPGASKRKAQQSPGLD